MTDEQPNWHQLLDGQWSAPHKYGFVLASGRPVLIEAFHMDETYADWLEGATNEASNQQRIARELASMTKAWGIRATHVIPPVGRVEERRDGRRNVKLPTYCYRAWLTSKAISDDYNGSELVVIWFAERDMERSLAGIVELACRDLSWESLAQDFEV